MEQQRTNIDVVAWVEDQEKDSFGKYTHDERNLFNDILYQFKWHELERANFDDQYRDLQQEIEDLEEDIEHLRSIIKDD
tara:strand:- start:885 stop:1121 length:237 start_codon:yes stop_codon:yes gene_type:complete